MPPNDRPVIDGHRIDPCPTAPDAEVVDAELALQLRDDTPDEVLVDLVDQDHEPEDPHRPRAHPHRSRLRRVDIRCRRGGFLGRVGHGGILAGWRGT